MTKLYLSSDEYRTSTAAGTKAASLARGGLLHNNFIAFLQSTHNFDLRVARESRLDWDLDILSPVHYVDDALIALGSHGTGRDEEGVIAPVYLDLGVVTMVTPTDYSNRAPISYTFPRSVRC